MPKKLQKWIYTGIGVYTLFTLILWHKESGGLVYMPQVIHRRLSLQLGNTSYRNQSKALFSKFIETAKNIRLPPRTVKPVDKAITCPNLQPPTNIIRDHWRGSHGDQVYMYSAYYEKSHNHVVVIGVHDKRGSPGFFCQLWGNDSTLQVTRAFPRDMPEHKGKRYSCAFYTCKMQGSMTPVAVSITTSECASSTSSIYVHGQEGDNGNFTVCVTPLNYNYSKAYELVEMIELNKLLGASHFVFYNYSINKNVEKVFNYYKTQGVELVDWNLPMHVDTWPRKNIPVEIHYFGQLGALNDCLYRNRYKSRYVVFQDLDEFIIPRKHLDWDTLFSTLPKNKGAYMFRNTFFRKDWPDTDANFTGKDIAQKFKSIVLLKHGRENKIFSRKHRSKYIVNPVNVDALGIHTINRFRGGGEHFVESDIALMHHYRDWENPKDKIGRTTDHRIMAFKDKLLERLSVAWGSLKDVPLGPLPFS